MAFLKQSAQSIAQCCAGHLVGYKGFVWSFGDLGALDDPQSLVCKNINAGLQRKRNRRRRAFIS